MTSPDRLWVQRHAAQVATIAESQERLRSRVHPVAPPPAADPPPVKVPG